ncbi:CAP domain-containing protein [Limnoraphis robusta]|uniref:CAP domain-containing protein n=1 Tax=Limnoraphis robusta TaxID=1118279 RepID=UPI003CC9A6C9
MRPGLRPAARFHSLDMGLNDFFSHQTPNGRAHAARIAAFDRTLLSEGTAENLAQFGPSVFSDPFWCSAFRFVEYFRFYIPCFQPLFN